MEIRIVIFLAFTSVTIITNTVLILFAYKALAGVVSKVTQTASEFQKSSEAGQWVESLHVASQRAAAVTESAKLKLAESAAVLSQAQENYHQTLTSLDTRLEEIAANINTAAETARDMVAKPAVSASKFAAGFMKVVGNFGTENKS